MSIGDVLSGAARWHIEQADCLQAMRAMPDDSVDLVFCSPPYASQRLYLEGGEDLGIARCPDEWVAWMIDICCEARRVCKGLCAFVVEGRTESFRYDCTPFLLMADLHRLGFHLRKPPVYQRNGIPGSGGPDWLRNDWEPIICFTKGGKLPWSDNTACGHKPLFAAGGPPSHRNAKGERKGRKVMSRERAGQHSQKSTVYKHPDIANPGNVIDCGAVGGGNMGSPYANENEAPYPEVLCEFFVLSFCKPDGVCLDPFSGSGSTVSVARRNGRRAIGIDLRASQVALGRKRVMADTPSMF